MGPLQKLTRQFGSATSDESFLAVLSKVETIASKLLSIAMVGVLAFSVFELFAYLIRELVLEPYTFFGTTLIEIFGLFLNVLIALEILENITAYLKKHLIQLELVVATSLTAVARKIIIFDFNKATGVDLIGLAFAVIALALSYWIIRRSVRRHG
jgi:uncharacterized membrane protein (DUF373 family)